MLSSLELGRLAAERDERGHPTLALYGELAQVLVMRLRPEPDENCELTLGIFGRDLYARRRGSPLAQLTSELKRKLGAMLSAAP
jgi:hypothetical protein